MPEQDKSTEKIQIPSSYIKTYYVVEKDDKGVVFSEVNESYSVIRFYLNEKLRPLLKLRDIQIYDSNGNRIY